MEEIGLGGGSQTVTMMVRSFIVLVLISSGVVFGFMLGEIMPWRDADKLLPFSFYSYLYPYLVFLLPNMFVMGVLFFLSGTLSRKILIVYVQGVLVVVLFIISKSLINQLDDRFLASLLDPFGNAAVKNDTAYWSIAQQNSKFVGLSFTVLFNRIVWMALALFGLIAVYKLFNFNVLKKGKSQKRH
ncbi:MAG: hypothetical protein HC831_22445 [Chloroflexia bacterium]|nr:hypothetical protein [Chloroflexia bacterium]